MTLDRFSNFFLDLIKLIKPEHRKWLVRIFVLAGISLVTHRVWEPYLEKIIGIKSSITADVTGWVFIVIGISLFLLNRYDDRYDKLRQPQQASASPLHGPRPLLAHSVEPIE